MHSLLSTNDGGGFNGALREITRSLRQFCLLQELGADPQSIASESRKLDELITACRAAFGAEALPDERLRALLVNEQERVATAAVLSEMVAPLLAAKLNRASGSAAPGTPPPPPASKTAARPPARVNGTPAIADMIDTMLAQDDAAAAWRRRDA